MSNCSKTDSYMSSFTGIIFPVDDNFLVVCVARGQQTLFALICQDSDFLLEIDMPKVVFDTYCFFEHAIEKF